MTPEECRARDWPHNERCRWTTGFYCESCDTFYAKNSPDYIRYELPEDLWFAVHNVAVVEFRRPGKPVPPQFDSVLNALHEVRRIDDADLRAEILNIALRLLAAYGKNEDSASIPLKF